MLPTPSTTHVPYHRVYEPSEDSFLLLDTLSAPSETAFLASHFPLSSSSSTNTSTTTSISTPSPLLLEIGPGSGVVLAFLTAHAQHIFGREDVLALGVDVNWHACAATGETVQKAVRESSSSSEERDGRGGGAGSGYFLGAVQGDLTGAVRPGTVDVLVFNPPYVPTDEVPSLLGKEVEEGQGSGGGKMTFEEDSRLLALAYAGGRDGMEITERVIAALPGVLSARGVAYLLLCAGNKPEEVKARIRGMEGGEWRAETVGTSGKQAGWEKLQIVRIWRD